MASIYDRSDETLAREARSLALDRALQHFRGYVSDDSGLIIRFADDLYYYVQDGTLPDDDEED